MIQLRPYQENLVQRIRESVKHGHKRIVTVLGCGGGKSYIQGMIAKSATDKGNRVLFVVHRKELCEQIRRSFTDCEVNFDLCDICMIQSVRRYKETPKLIIVDEAHHSLAKSYLTLFARFPEALVLGFTATPIRLNQGGLGEVYEDLIEGVSTQWLIDNHYLSPAKYYGYKTVDTSHLRKTRGDFRQSDVNDLFQNNVIYGDVIKEWKEKAGRKKTILYAPNIETANNVCQAFLGEGISAEELDGKTPKDRRKQVVEDFRQGKVTILCNCELFGEGFDVPDCECVILLRPTASLTVYLQQAMRCMRYKEGKTAIVIDHVQNIQRHGLPEQSREWTLDGIQKDTDEAKIRTCPECFGVCDAKKKICPYCGAELVKHDSREKQKAEHVDGELEEITAEELAKRKDEAEMYKRFLKIRGVEMMKSDDILRLIHMKTWEQVEAVREMKGYKIGWSFHTCEKLGIPIPKKYEYRARRYSNVTSAKFI